MTWMAELTPHDEPLGSGIPEPFASADNLGLLRRIAWEAEQAKQLLRRRGFGVTGAGLLETVREALNSLEDTGLE